MKIYSVIGNPIEHSLSPKIHNYWFKENGIEAKYEKQSLLDSQLEDFVKKIKNKEIYGANVTVPFKEKIIPFMDKLTYEASEANSVNTIYLYENNVVGHNTDIFGFYFSIKSKNINFKNKNALILGSGGVTPSIIIGLKKLGFKKITISNRTKDKAIKLKKKFDFLEVLDWGKTKKANIIINSTSLGLKENDNINLDQFIFDPDSFFYDVIYNPKETNFLKNAKSKGFLVQNGLMMFVYQAAEAFKTWHNIKPKIDKKLIEFMQND